MTERPGEMEQQQREAETARQREQQERSRFIDQEASDQRRLELEEENERQRIADADRAELVRQGLLVPEQKSASPTAVKPKEAGVLSKSAWMVTDVTGGAMKFGWKKFSEGWDAFFKAIEEHGDKMLGPYKRHMRVVPWLVTPLSFVLGVGMIVGSKILSSPSEKSLADRRMEEEKKEKEAAKKLAADKKRKADEARKLKALKDAGIDEAAANVALDVGKSGEDEDDGNKKPEQKKPKPKPEEKKES